MNALLLISFALILVIHIAGCCAFMVYIKKLHKEQVNYLHSALKTINPTIEAPQAVFNRTEKPIAKGRAWVPKRDIDHVMSGKIVDFFD